MPDDAVKKRARELRAMLKGPAPVEEEISGPKIISRRPTEKKGEVIPTGSVIEKPGWVEVISKQSFQKQYIPKTARRFKDVITGNIEER